MEKSLVLVKPDGVKRGLVGEIISRFEKAGLKIVGMKLVWVTDEMIAKHYPMDRTEFLRGMGEKTLKTYEEFGKNPIEEVGTTDALEIGKMINVWNAELLTSGPVVALVLEGNHAVENVRRIVGPTLPNFAPPGSIRGDYSSDSAALANTKKRAVRNLIHASGNKEEAEYEISIWFDKSEMHSYKRADEDVMF